MRHVPTLLGRELAAYFLGPMAYLVLLAFQLIASLNFWELVDILSAPHRELSSLRDPMNTYIPGQPRVLDRDAGRDPPAHDEAVRRGAPPGHDRGAADGAGDRDRGRRRQVAGRRGDVLASCWSRSSCTCRSFHFRRSSDFDLGPIMSLAVGLATMGMMFVSIGLFLSSLTRNQIIAAIWTFVVLLFLIVRRFRSLICSPCSSTTPGPMPCGSWRSFTRSRASGRELFDLRYIAVHLSVCVFMLSLTVKVLEMRSSV